MYRNLIEVVIRFRDLSSAGYNPTYRFIHRLSEQEESHFIALAKIGDLSARERLLVHRLPLLKMAARRYAERGLRLGELINEGMFGLAQIDSHCFKARGDWSAQRTHIVCGETDNLIFDAVANSQRESREKLRNEFVEAVETACQVSYVLSKAE